MYVAVKPMLITLVFLKGPKAKKTRGKEDSG